jgi:hypothetical protein
MSLLTLIQQTCRAPGVNLPRPNAVATSTNDTVLQLLELANEEGVELSRRGEWQALRRTASFTSVATNIQTSLATAAPFFDYMINDSFWDQTLRRPLFGPLTVQEYQQQVSMFSIGPWYQYIILDGDIVFVPAPSAGDTCSFAYMTTAWCTDSTGASPQTAFTADADVSLLDEQIMKLGIIWRWKQGKGLDYAEDYAKYERMLEQALGRDASKPVLNAGGVTYDVMPAILVPAGSWNV